MDRREFIKGAASLAACGALGTPVFAKAKKARRLVLHYFTSHEGKMIPAPVKSLRRVYFADADYNPLMIPIAVPSGDGVLVAPEPGQPYKIICSGWVDGFGDVYMVADNGGKGYEPGTLGREINLNEEIAKSRLKSVEAAGSAMSTQVGDRLSKAGAVLSTIAQGDSHESRARKSWDSLNESLWAGEMVVFERAKRAIAKRGARPGFKFGAAAFAILSGHEAYTKAYCDLLDYGTLPFYFRSFEQVRGKPDWDKLDRMVDWCEKHGVTPKGHPLVWFNPAGIPDWMHDKSFEDVKSIHKHRIKRIVDRYKGRIDRWDVINEAHDFANDLHFSYDQLFDLTRMACDTARAANPNSMSVINSTCLWGEYAAPRAGKELPSPIQRTPHQYLTDCVREKLDFDVIGLQVYYPGWDMFEIDRMLERFGRLGKPVHITEQSVASDTAKDTRALDQDVNGYWHAPFSQAVQADWVEQFWTIAYSKDCIQAISYWDLADYGGHFWPHGGLLDGSFKPKESYRRLKALVDSWRKAQI